MRTLLIILGGFLLLGLCLQAGRWLSGTGAKALGVRFFLPLWFAVAAWNMYFGVEHAGYGFRDELPVFLVIFGLPALAAGALWWKFP
jgi:hypothetical protein